ncbi:MAG: hypothetical protein ABIQ30_03200 [Devosia sp.]
MDGKTKNTAEVYRGEAAELMAAAARVADRPKAGPAPFPRQPAAPPVVPESRRPLPYPEPIGINDNLTEDQAPPLRRERRRVSIPRVLARVLISPLYLAVAALSLGVLFLFVKGFIA